MKRDIILSAVIAIAVHAGVLSAQIPKAGRDRGKAHAPIVLSIVAPAKAVAVPPPVERRLEPVSRPLVSPKEKPPTKETIAPEKRLLPKETVTTEAPVKEKKVSAKKTQEVREETLLPPGPVKLVPQDKAEAVGENAIEEAAGRAETPSAFKRASIQKHVDGFEKGRMAPEQGLADGTVTYAIPRIKEGSRPVYPKVAERRGYEGTVRLEVEILETGDVGKVKILESSGFEVLDKEAVRWVNTNPFVHGLNHEKRTYLVPVVFTEKSKEEVSARKRKN